MLALAMKLHKDTGDFLDFYLVGSSMAASFPVFMETMDPYGTADGFLHPDDPDSGKTRCHEAAPGTILYGNLNEKPHILKNDHIGRGVQEYVRLMQRNMTLSTGMAYEVSTKDFLQANYSSIRAALLECGRVFSL